MRVTEHRKPVRPEREDVVDGAVEGCRRLQRQAVDQIDVDRGKARLAQPGERLKVVGVRLHAMDRELHPRIGVLHAERRAVCPNLSECGDVVAGKAAGINFHTELALRRRPEVGADQRAEPPQFVGWEKRRRAAAEMDLGHGPRAVHAGRGQLHLAGEIIQVLAGGIPLQRNHRVTPAEPTPRLAERQVEIQRDRPAAGAVVGRDRRFEPERRQVFRKLRRRRVRRVTGSGHGILLDQIELQTWRDGFARGGHDGSMSAAQKRRSAAFARLRADIAEPKRHPSSRCDRAFPTVVTTLERNDNVVLRRDHVFVSGSNAEKGIVAPL